MSSIKSIKRVISIFVFIMFFAMSTGWGYYHYDDFDAADADWSAEYRYSRAMGTHTENNDLTVAITGGVLRFSGDGLSSTYNNELYQFNSRRTGDLFDASINMPFGYEVTRDYARIDPHNDSSNDESGRMKADMILWLVENNMTADGYFENFITFIDFCRPQLGVIGEAEPDTQPFSFWTLNEGGSRTSKFQMTNVLDGAGNSVDMEELMEWGYDDRWGKETVGGGQGTFNGDADNDNKVRFRVTIDGEYARLYINPAPDGNPTANKTLRDGSTLAFNNTFYLIKEVPVSFSNDLMPMLGVGNNRVDAEANGLEADFNDFIIRSVSTSVTSEISPTLLKAGGTADIHCVITPTFTGLNEAGIQQIYIDLPAGYTNWADYTSDFYVFKVTNGAVDTTFAKVTGDSDPANNTVAISIKSNNGQPTRLKIRFSADAQNNVYNASSISADTLPAIMFVISNFTTLSTADSSGVDFAIWVGNEKYADTTYSSHATTGWMKSYAGNAYDMTSLGISGDSDTLKLKTVNDPIAVGGLRPNFIYEGESSTFYYDIASTVATNNNADVTEVRIKVPAGFPISSSGLGTDRLTNVNGVYTTNISGDLYIVADYAAEGKALVAGSGIDTIRFNTTDTTNLVNTNEVWVDWESTVYSSVDGTGFATNGTNSIYPIQRLLVRKKPPNAQAYIYCNGDTASHKIKNTLVSNSYSYVVKNNGASGNNIQKLFIQVDATITNIGVISTGLPSTTSVWQNFTNANITNTDGSYWVLIDYDAGGSLLSNGLNDTITYAGFDNVKSLTNVIISASSPSYADNGNGDDWVSVSEHGDSWDYSYYTPPAVVRAAIDTPDEEGGEVEGIYYHHVYNDLEGWTNMSVIIKNWGEADNHIYYAKIYCPLDITNIASVSSTWGGITTITTEGATNVIIIDYTTGDYLEADPDTPSAGKQDSVSFRIWDNVTNVKDVTFRVEAKNTTNYATAGQFGSDNMNINFIYPPASANGYVSVPLGYIPAETNQYELTYHVNNTGRTGNKLKNVYIKIDTNYVSGVSGINSSLGDTTSYGGGYVTINYTNGQFVGGTSDTITFTVSSGWGPGKSDFDMPFNVRNDRGIYSNMPTTGGQSQTIQITPPPTRFKYNILPTVMYTETNTNELYISVTNWGVGNNQLTKLRIEIPAEFVGNILMLSNTYNDWTNNVPISSSGNLWVSNGNYIWVDYTNGGSSLPSGEVDKIYVKLLNDTIIAGDTLWNMEAMNSSTNVLTNGTMLSIGVIDGTNRVSLISKPAGFITPDVVQTPTIVNAYTYNVANGYTNVGRDIIGVRLMLPDYGQYFSKVSNIGGLASPTTYVSNSYQVIEGTHGGLSPQATFNITYHGYDVWSSGSNTVTVEMYVNYGDGSGWHPSRTSTTVGKSKTVTFLNPPAEGEVYVAPNNLPQDFPTNLYTFEIENIGDAGNNIQRAVIEAPDFITNIVSAVSIVKNADYVVTTNASGVSNIVILYYTNALMITSGQNDTVKIVGADNIDAPSETSGVWVIKLDNTTNGAGLGNASVKTGKSLNLNIIKPPYNTFVFIENLASSKKNIIDSTKPTNYMKFYIINQSATYNENGVQNKIVKARIKIPGIGTVLNTNTMQISNLIKTSATATLSNDYIVIDYSGSPISSGGASDEVIIEVDDLITHGETNLSWSAEVVYETTHGIYKSTSQQSGRSLAMAYQMPTPTASVNITPTEIYMNKAEFVLHYPITNMGSGTSDLDRVVITLPEIFRTGFGVINVSNSTVGATSTNYNSGTGELTLMYDSFNPGDLEDLYLYISNTATNYQSVTIDATIRNYVNTATISGNNDLFVSTVPSFYVTPNTLDTSTESNNFKLYLNNDINGSLSMKKIRLSFPSEFTNMLYTNSSQIDDSANILGMITSLTLDYQNDGNAVAVGDWDLLDITFADGYEIGHLTNIVSAWVDNGDGYVPMTVRSGKSSNITFVMPDPQTFSELEYDSVYLGVISNSNSITITNKGTGTSRLTYSKIYLPDEMVSISGIQSSYGGVVSYDEPNNVITVKYTNFLETNKNDTVLFAYENEMNKVTNMFIQVKVANTTNNPEYFTSPGLLGDSLVLTVTYPPLAAEGAFYNDNQLYLIETNATLTYRIVNRSYGSPLTNAIIEFKTNIFNVFDSVSLSSDNATTITFDSNNNRWLVDYGANLIDYTSYDDLTFSFAYHLSNTMVIDVDTIVTILQDGTNATNIATLAVGGNKSYIGVTNSTWGSVRGDVFPPTKAVNVKIYYTNTTDLATNVNGANLGTVSGVGSGEYLISRIPNGIYDIEYNESYYRGYTKRVMVDANLMKIISTVTMRNAPLISGDSSGKQTVYCYEDTNTKMEFQEGAIDESFSLDINKRFFTDPQKSGANSQSEIIIKPKTTDLMYGYWFMQDKAEKDKGNTNVVEGTVLKLDAILYLGYDESEMTTTREWIEDSLAIFYWDAKAPTPQWVRIGGKVDKDANVVVAKVGFVHEFYAVMSKNAAGEGAIQNVVLRPKVFTPTKDTGGYFGNIRLTFEFEQDQEGYEVKIYDLKGTLLKLFKRDGTYSQGEVAWDGLDEEGYPVVSGVYVYRVIAGDNVYSGTVIIAR